MRSPLLSRAKEKEKPLLDYLLLDLGGALLASRHWEHVKALWEHALVVVDTQFELHLM